MITTSIGILVRIVSNSLLNVFQKLLTESGTKSSVVNFYTYFGLIILSLILFPKISLNFSIELFVNFLMMGILGTAGNYFIIKALSIAEMSSLAPINSYKPVVALIISFIYLREIPSIYALSGIFLIISGTLLIKNTCLSKNKIALFYRVLALIFSGTEAVFIKKVILLTNVPTSFILWAFAGFIFSFALLIFSKNKPIISSTKYQVLLILAVGLMQYSTNFVFSKINVSYALALFQLSTLLSVFFGMNIFHEGNISKKIIASTIMILGAVIIILT